jgi:hypothetical protein
VNRIEFYEDEKSLLNMTHTSIPTLEDEENNDEDEEEN